VAELEARLRKDELSSETVRIPDKDTLRNLAHDLAAVWNLPATDMRLKQRIVRILVAEIVADIDQENQQIVLLIHWTGGQHSELRVKKNATGKHNRCTSLEAIEIIRRMAGKFPDDQIAATLNRPSLRTGMGNTWREGNVRTVRSYHELPAFTASQGERSTLTMEEASTRLAVSHKIVRRLIEAGKIPATQVVPCAPWEISAEAVESKTVLEEIERIKQRVRPLRATSIEELPMFAEL
jgi:excisionase family DNA binding protein